MMFLLADSRDSDRSWFISTGGGFDGLSSALTLISDRFVAEQDVVLGGINHRANVLGYTYLGGLDSRFAESGNVGLLDLIAALNWVRDNIENLRGDPANVTLFGESRGGGKISNLLAMPAANGDFSSRHHRKRFVLSQGTNGRDPLRKTPELILFRLGLTDSSLRMLWEIPVDKLLAAYVSRDGTEARLSTDNPSHFKPGRRVHRRRQVAYH